MSLIRNPSIDFSDATVAASSVGRDIKDEWKYSEPFETPVGILRLVLALRCKFTGWITITTYPVC